MLKSIIIFVLFQLAIPPVVHTITGNRWVKLPVFLVVGILAGIFMAWLHYVPFLLFIFMLGGNKHSLDMMQEPEFKARVREPIRKPVYYVSTYSYIIVACVSASIFQAEVVDSTDPRKPATLL